jgi:CRISPR-associated protein Cas2
MSSHYVVVYDSDSDSSRRKVRSAIRAFGGWKQYSVFECVLTPTMYAELTDQLRDIIAECDGMTRIRLYKLPHGTSDIATLPDEDSETKSNNII